MFLELRLESYREVPVEQVTSRHRVHDLEERIMLGVEFGRYDELLDTFQQSVLQNNAAG